MKTVSRK